VLAGRLPLSAVPRPPPAPVAHVLSVTRPSRGAGERRALPRAGPCGKRPGGAPSPLHCSSDFPLPLRQLPARRVSCAPVTGAPGGLRRGGVPMRKHLPKGDLERDFFFRLAYKRPFERSFRFLEGGAFPVTLFLLIFLSSLNDLTSLQMCWS